ncbi:hypothetical protein DEH81_03530 [Pectobacterium zantedeschiae]|nr:hypothetical protein DEH81_03530 [Pectobacterium zantedeschiae]
MSKTLTNLLDAVMQKSCACPSYFKLHVRWLLLLTPVTYLCKLPGTRAVAALRGSEMSPALTGQRFALFKTPTFCPATRII